MQLALLGLVLYLVSTAASPLDSASPAPRAELPRVPAPAPATPDANRYAVISERNLFETRDQPVAVEPAEEQLQETGLGLRLLGTTVSKTPERSVASVEDVARNETLALRIDDTAAGAKLVRIERGRIVLDNGGVLEWLLLADDQGAAGSAANATPGRPAVRTARSAAGGVSRPPTPGAASLGRAVSGGSASAPSHRTGGSSAGRGAAGGAVAGAGGKPGAVQSARSGRSDSDFASSAVIVEADGGAPPQPDRPATPENNQADPHRVASVLQTAVGTNGLDLQAGELIVAMDGQNVTSPAGIEEAMRSFFASGRTTLTIIAVDGSTRSLLLTVAIGGPAR